MSGRLKNLLHTIFLNAFTWKLFQPLRYITSRLEAAKQYRDQRPAMKEMHALAQKVLHTSTVLHGPFKGMIYGNEAPSGSSYYAKLLGSYESEIHDFIHEAINRTPSEVINIGCDEGFYAIGLSIATGKNVIAFDVYSEALEATATLASNNNISGRLILKAKCDAKEISQLEINNALLMIDCEGDEINILTSDVAGKLKKADIIVELHLHLHPELERQLRSIFGSTHYISVANSIDDHQKVMTYKFAELNGLSYKQKRFILEEREVFMQWMYLKSKSR